FFRQVWPQIGQIRLEELGPNGIDGKQIESRDVLFQEAPKKPQLLTSAFRNWNVLHLNAGFASELLRKLRSLSQVSRPEGRSMRIDQGHRLRLRSAGCQKGGPGTNPHQFSYDRRTRQYHGESILGRRGIVNPPHR